MRIVNKKACGWKGSGGEFESWLLKNSYSTWTGVWSKSLISSENNEIANKKVQILRADHFKTSIVYKREIWGL